MSNYRQCKAYLINAFLALDDERPEDDRLRRAVERVLDAVARAERDAMKAKAERSTMSSNPNENWQARSGNVVALRR